MSLSNVCRVVFYSVAVAGACSAPGSAGAQIVSGGGKPAPVAPSVVTAANDERLKLAARFAQLYARGGSMGTAISEVADLDALFVAMFGREDWADSTPEEKEEVTRLYVEAMNLASRRAPDEKPEPLQPGDMAVSDSDAASAKVRLAFRVKSRPEAVMLRMRKQDDRWRVIDGYAVGEDSWSDNIKKVYARFRGRTTPVACMRQVHELVSSMSKNQAATSRPGDE